MIDKNTNEQSTANWAFMYKLKPKITKIIYILLQINIKERFRLLITENRKLYRKVVTKISTLNVT